MRSAVWECVFQPAAAVGKRERRGRAQVLTQAGGTVKEAVCRALVVLLTNAPELHAYAARAFFRALRDAPGHPPPLLLATTAAWFLGARPVGQATLG